MTNNINIKIFSGVAVLAIIWGSTWLAIKFGLMDAPPFLSAALRFIVAFITLFIWLKFTGYKFPLTLSYWKRASFIALFMFIIPYAFVYWGELYISSGLAAVLFSSQSLFVIFFSHYFLINEKATIIKYFGLFLGLAGLFIIFFDKINWTDWHGFIGMTGLIIAAASGAFGLVWLKKKGETVEPVPEVTAQLGITAIAFIILSLIFEKTQIEISSVKLWGSIIYLAIPGTAIAFVIYFWLAKNASALIASFSIFLAPIFAVFLGWLILYEIYNIRSILGTILVLFSIVITQLNMQKIFCKKTK